MRSSRLTLSAGLPHSWIWRVENGSLYLSSLPLSLPLSLASGYFECCSFYSEIKYVLRLCLFFKLKNWRNIKSVGFSTNRDRKLIMHKKTFILSIRIQKIKDIKKQMPNKLIKLENKKFKDFVCEILGWNDFNTLLLRYRKTQNSMLILSVEFMYFFTL